MYQCDQLDGEFRQGEIVSNLVYYDFSPEIDEITELTFDFGVVVNQDCDLLRDHNAYLNGHDSTLIGILIFPASPCDVARASVGNSAIWGRVKKNDADRYHVLQSIVPELDLAGAGLPDLLIDFRKFFVVAPAQLRWQIASGQAQRRCRLVPAYREHLQNRMANYFSRVSLDAPHVIAS